MSAAEEVFAKLGEASNMTAEQIEEVARKIQAALEEVADYAGPITYTNRAARRARARAERKAA